MKQVDIDIAKKSLNKILDGEHHYFYLLEDFINQVEKQVKAEESKIPALLREH
jgi:hypothetical protein